MIYIILGILALILVYVFATYNSLIKLRNKVEEGFSTMDVYLKKRWDLIPNLVETVKGYAKHEKETLNQITELRKGSYNSMDDDAKLDVNNKLSQNITKLLAVAENYPELKASDNFKELSAQLSQIEEDIAQSRKYYNGTVRIYNNKVQMLPSNIVANLFGFKSKKMFETDEAERENVKVEF